MELSDFLIILISIVVTGMVPWGYVMHGRLTAIEVAVKQTAELRDRLQGLTQSFHDIEIRLVKIENGQ